MIDTGDRIEGNGLYDGSDPKGQYYYDLFKHQPIDLLCSGNHELYKANSSNDELYHTIPNYKGSYIASNLDIIDPDRGTREPLASRYRKFETKNQKLKVLSFGFLFDFTGNANNTIVQPVAETVKEEWFRNVLQDKELDVIIVIGHVGVRMPEFKLIFQTIRQTQPDTPILFFGGHVHIRDYTMYDQNSAAIASGRYLETVGFMSVDGIQRSNERNNKHESTTSINVSRQYIDKNLYSFYQHTGLNSTTFPTRAGQSVSRDITKARQVLNLDKIHGCVPRSLYVNRAPFPSKASLFSWLVDEVFPSQFLQAPRVKNEGKKALVMTNTGALRFDIFKGPFTRDSEFLVSPFTSEFRFVKDVPAKIAGRVLELLISENPWIKSVVNTNGRRLENWMLVPPEQIGDIMATRSARQLEDHQRQQMVEIEVMHGDQVPLPASLKHDDLELRPGYTTIDDAGHDGDDTKHSPIEFFNVPSVVQASIGGLTLPPDPHDDQPVDLVYNEFIQPWIVLALQDLGMTTSEKDTQRYWGGKTLTNVMTDWIDENWKC